MSGPNAPYTALDPSQVLVQSFDESTDRLRVDANFTFDAGQAEVSINAEDDSVRIEDGNGNALAINPDGSINTNVSISPGPPGVSFNAYNEVTSVPSSSLVDVVTYTAPPATTTTLSVIEVSGTNIATFTVTINGTAIAKKRTYFGSELNANFDFAESGLSLSPGDIVVVNVIHERPDLGEFNARIQTLEV